MKNKILPLLSVVCMMLFSTCSNEELSQESDLGITPEAGRKILLTASMPEEPTTRVGLEQNADKSIALTWEVGDELQLAFVKGENKAKSIVTASKIYEDGKKAQFDIILPDGFDNGTFDLYGVYGGGGLSDDDPTQIILPTGAGNATSLEGNEPSSVQNRKDVMLYFKSTGIDATNLQPSATFQHLGSLFSITLKNIGTESLDNLNEAILLGVDVDGNPLADGSWTDGTWAYNAGAGGKTYDLVTGKFQETTSAGNDISFKAAENSLAADETITFWGWYPPLPRTLYPRLQLQLKDETNNLVAKSFNSMPERTSFTLAGKSYYFFAVWDGSELNFTDSVFTPPFIPGKYNVTEMGSLSSLLGDDKNTLTRLILTGMINKADFDVMKSEMPNLTYLDLSGVICEDNKIPNEAIGSTIAISANKTITTIILPQSITAIGDYAFSRSGLVGSLTIPNKVEVIGEWAFSFCQGLNGSLIFQEGSKLTRIGNRAFMSCNYLTGPLNIPDKVTVIEDYAFGACSKIRGLTLPEGLETIGDGAFLSCSLIEGTVVFPTTLTSIGKRGFEGLSWIDAFRFLSETPIAYTEKMLWINTYYIGSKPIQVPAGSVNAYKEAPGWIAHDANIVAIPDE